MNKMGELEQGNDSQGLIRCATCSHFEFFPNEKGHNSTHALGECQTKAWDGNSGQWAMFQHPCKNFILDKKKNTENV
jgi:hypothetical protein